MLMPQVIFLIQRQFTLVTVQIIMPVNGLAFQLSSAIKVREKEL